MNTKFNKFVSSPQARLKFKKQCLKAKNILFENDNLQIACKLSPFYDFYSSRNYLQMQIFIGNKTQRKIQNFTIHYKGTRNLELFVEQKTNSIGQSAQFKQRVLIECNSLEEEILVLLDFHSDILTLKSIPLPITLFSFCAIKPQQVTTLPLTSSYSQLSDLLSSRYQYIEQMEVTVNVGIFKKGLLKDLPKYLNSLTSHADNLLVGQFTLRDMTQQYTLAFVVSDEMKMKIVLCSNKYDNFELILNNLKFLLST